MIRITVMSKITLGGLHVSNKLVRTLLVITVGAIIWFLPVPAGVKPAAWHLLAIFTATILGFILQPDSYWRYSFL